MGLSLAFDMIRKVPRSGELSLKIPSDTELAQLASRLAPLLISRGLRLVTVESCTAGFVAKVLTDLPGSSRWFDCGFVTYSNEAKVRDVGVASATLARHGAVSEEVVKEMAVGALRATQREVAVAISGIAGPDGGTADKPVGTVWFCVAHRAPQEALEVSVRKEIFSGDRDAVRRASVKRALELVASAIERER